MPIWGTGDINGEVNAWLMPNDYTPTGMKMDTYLVSPATLTKLTHIEFDIPKSQLSQKDNHSRQKPSGCSIK